jgi:ABC-type bacteriocin/lantibiotic exporter with double-glycine peptidase domain
MIFDFIKEQYPDSTVPDFDLDRIGKICKTLRLGTLPADILNLNKVPEVTTINPSVEFEFKLRTHPFEELVNEIDLKQPPIAWIWTSDELKKKKFDHAIVVTGIEDGRVYYNDPVFGKLSMTKDEFLSKWDDEDRVLVKVKIGQKKPRKDSKITQYMEQFNKDNKQIANQEVSKDGNES